MTPNSKRRPELDGLRGLAILLVVAAHMWNGVFPHNAQLIPGTPKDSGGGFVGVQLFFVLSGFLITGLLVAERERTGQIRLGAFYGRRARRLLPALVIVTGAYLIFSLATRTGAELHRALGSCFRAAFYIEDLPVDRWIPTDEYLGHTWSLAVEEQFYLFWPIILIAALWLGGRRAAIGIVIAGIVFTTVVRLAAAHAGIGIYERTHWDALLVGCLLALVPLRLPAWVGWVALAPMAVITVDMIGGADNPWLFSITAFAGGALIATAGQMRWLRARWLIFFGTISYGLYLWHVLLLRAGYHPLPTILVSIAVATASFYLVERRFLRHSRVALGPLGQRHGDDGLVVVGSGDEPAEVHGDGEVVADGRVGVVDVDEVGGGPR